MKNKGFTLIELLSVIVVLALIALITIPIISGVVNKARLNALKASAYGLVDAGNLYYAQYGVSSNTRFDKNDNENTLKELRYKGNVKEGTVIINKRGKITVCITDGKNSAYKNYNESTVTLVSKKTCTVPSNTNIVYLDDEATLTELSNQELTDKVAELEELINNKPTSVVGSMQIFAGSAVPEGYLLCDGQAVSRSEYSKLFEAIGTTWGAGDGSTTFNVPDMREVAPVGIGQSNRTEGTHDVFTLGEFKDDQLQKHTHSMRYWTTSGGASPNVSGGSNFGDRSGTGNNNGRSGTVTRGKRIGVNYIIKY